jgi:hypothetical protein
VTVDVADYELVEPYRWYALILPRVTYAHALITPRPERKHVYMHRFLLDAPTGVDVDHIDHDGLNNCRSNLRLASRRQNLANMRPFPEGKSSSYKGVCWRPRERAWTAQIRLNGKHVYLGKFSTEIAAARAYDAAALAHRGEFACINFPREGAA